jgi:hypothetical protein
LKLKLFLLSVFIATLATGLVAFVNYSREGAAAFSNGPWLYISYFAFMVIIVIVGTIVLRRMGDE